MVNGWLGLLAALLLVIPHFHIWWSQEIRMYSLASVLSLFSLVILLRAVRLRPIVWGYLLFSQEGFGLRSLGREAYDTSNPQD